MILQQNLRVKKFKFEDIKKITIYFIRKSHKILPGGSGDWASIRFENETRFVDFSLLPRFEGLCYKIELKNRNNYPVTPIVA